MPPRKNLLKISEATPKIKITITTFLERITKCRLDTLLEGKLLAQYGGPFIEVFLVNEKLFNLLKTLISNNINPYAVGLHIATLDKEGLKPSLPLAKFIHRKCRINNYCHVKINDFGEKTFLYGKAVLKQNIVEYNCLNSIGIVVNLENEPLGWGLLQSSDRKELLLKNLNDVGWYVRMGG